MSWHWACCCGEEPPTPTGACCDLSDGSCTVETEVDCLNAGNQYLGDGTDCGPPNPCPQPTCDPCSTEHDTNCDTVCLATYQVTVTNWIRATGDCFPFPNEYCVDFVIPFVRTTGCSWIRFVDPDTSCSGTCSLCSPAPCVAPGPVIDLGQLVCKTNPDRFELTISQSCHAAETFACLTQEGGSFGVFELPITDCPCPTGSYTLVDDGGTLASVPTVVIS